MAGADGTSVPADPFGLAAKAPEFSWELAQDTETRAYHYRATVKRPGVKDWRSEWEPLPTQDEGVAREMARERMMMVAAMVVGATVENISAVRGIGDDGQPAQV